MKKYAIEGKIYIVDGDRLFVSVTETELGIDLIATVEPISKAAADRPPKRGLYKKHDENPEAKRRTIHCKKCGEAGHRSDGCDNKKLGAPKEAGDTLEDSDMKLEDLREKVQELKDEGLTSVQIAARLHRTLAIINKVW